MTDEESSTDVKAREDEDFTVPWKAVLIVDDSVVYRETMAYLMRPYCERVLTASNAREAMELIENSQDLDFILSDIVMDEGDGFELLAYVRTLPEPKPKIMMVSGFFDDWGEEEMRRIVSQDGALACIKKPSGLREIATIFQRMVVAPELPEAGDEDNSDEE